MEPSVVLALLPVIVVIALVADAIMDISTVERIVRRLTK